MITLTKSERQIMEIIWHADHPMAQGEVVAACKWKSRCPASMKKVTSMRNKIRIDSS